VFYLPADFLEENLAVSWKKNQISKRQLNSEVKREVDVGKGCQKLFHA
jgi:hypothetical protein